MEEIIEKNFSLFSLLPFVFFGFLFFEAMAIWLFRSWPFRIGPKVLSFQEDWGNVKISPQPKVIETTNGKYKVIQADEIIFRYAQPIFEFNIGTPIPFKGRVLLRNGKAFITARIPLAPSLFLGFWICGWLFGSFGIVFLENQLGLLKKIIFLPVFLGIPGAIFCSIYFLEKKRFISVLNEMKETLSLKKTPDRNSENLTAYEKRTTRNFFIFIILFWVIGLSVSSLFQK